MKVHISNCYATGSVTGAGEGGFAHQFYGSVLQNNFWNTETSGKATGVGNGNAAGITGKTTAQMADSSTFTGAGFSDAVWDFSSPSGPKLDWQMPPDDSAYATTLQVGANNDVNARLTVNTSFSLGEFAIDLSTIQSAREAIDLCDSLLNSITTKQSSIGASTNKLHSILTSNNYGIENLTSAKSVITDTDMAKETAQMVRNQILKQTGITMLSNYKESNAQLLLSLLK
ncbi:MAG: flagellin [bacterium]